MKNPAHWTKKELHEHLQHAVDVEFWTIPLYLTALYSIKGLKTLKKENYPDAAKLIQSVVIQEMLHLEIVCNICNALGYAPCFHPPQYDESKSIPFIHPKKEILPSSLHGYVCRPGGLNEETLKLFCAIELPHARSEINWDTQKYYHSIADMYTALKEGILNLWPTCFVGDAKNLKQKNTFREYHNKEGRGHGFSQAINNLESALKGIDAIVEQGEGADSKHVHADFRPPKIEEGKEFDPGWFRGELSHYHKFYMLLYHHKHLPEVYGEMEGADASQEQLQLNIVYHSFLLEMNKSFNDEGEGMTNEFWNNMFALSNSIMAVWEKGARPMFSSS
ncbi:ferritin-like protein [soil metagenome]